MVSAIVPTGKEAQYVRLVAVREESHARAAKAGHEVTRSNGEFDVPGQQHEQV